VVKASYHWYEKLFYRLIIREGSCLRLVIYLIILLILCQGFLTNHFIRKHLVLVEKYEGAPVKFYKSLKGGDL
jgi:fumarate reductase subunit C